jgi:hypothetical protein
MGECQFQDNYHASQYIYEQKFEFYNIFVCPTISQFNNYNIYNLSITTKKKIIIIIKKMFLLTTKSRQ